jgi:hypothetical protein
LGNGSVNKSLKGEWEKCARVIPYSEVDELSRVKMIAGRLDARNNEVSSMRTLIHVAEMQEI